MNVTLRRCLWAEVACLTLGPVLLFAQPSDLAQNLADCKSGRDACDRSRLSQSELVEVALARHEHNVSDCRNGYDSCDRSKLSEPEAIAAAVADHRRNVSNCNDGIASCDQSKLTRSEARETAVAEHLRNLENCKDRIGTCDRSKLTQSETTEVNVVAGASATAPNSLRWKRVKPPLQNISVISLLAGLARKPVTTQI